MDIFSPAVCVLLQRIPLHLAPGLLLLVFTSAKWGGGGGAGLIQENKGTLSQDSTGGRWGARRKSINIK